MTWFQTQISLSPKQRGFHLVTGEITAKLVQLGNYRMGMAHFFLLHTSASLCINENADPDVRLDMAAFVDRLVPENAPYFRHTIEGPDDMPAHIKAALLGCSLSIPIGHGKLALGTWQGIYLGEHRDHGGPRRIQVTLTGQVNSISSE